MKHPLALLPVLLCGCVVPVSNAQWPNASAEGYFVTWQTVDARGISGDCRPVADVVRVTANDALTGERQVFNFDCRANRGELGLGVTSGSTVSVELIDCEGAFCLQGGAPVATFSVDNMPALAGGARVDLGPFAFDAL
jgi:hypothetical protein